MHALYSNDLAALGRFTRMASCNHYPLALTLVGQSGASGRLPWWAERPAHKFAPGAGQGF